MPPPSRRALDCRRTPHLGRKRRADRLPKARVLQPSYLAVCLQRDRRWLVLRCNSNARNRRNNCCAAFRFGNWFSKFALR